MNYLILSAFILFSTTAVAQECDPEQIQQKPGTWKAAMPGSQNGSATDLAREKKISCAFARHDQKQIQSNGYGNKLQRKLQPLCGQFAVECFYLQHLGHALLLR